MILITQIMKLQINLIITQSSLIKNIFDFSYS